ncbi:MAG: hypothetical protein COU35_02125 [Candidatus Magasanikbacteria bacterium CG10_big_fil_rev_8_21_14_0_10_47_10]|uniref:Uncharacterized protein n=1 Tax=Candidatus Magasanikbacteria bacterium CG10_big_fil_rev_8_21_14_0_10_47_10 TaxID=1974652 RepID=A0A2H0TQX6_9BACT|nr:MAG: hypothetical protein COU35_02125 [Candidatus Magasanikbacteria bacterium CG10_big_fil_rev_8_21_14_0_10_47_10]
MLSFIPLQDGILSLACPGFLPVQFLHPRLDLSVGGVEYVAKRDLAAGAPEAVVGPEARTAASAAGLLPTKRRLQSGDDVLSVAERPTLPKENPRRPLRRAHRQARLPKKAGHPVDAFLSRHWSSTTSCTPRSRGLFDVVALF